MQKPQLVIMAAGIGSRFGEGIKQLTPLGPNGEIIMDYSIKAAMDAGFVGLSVILVLKNVMMMSSVFVWITHGSMIIARTPAPLTINVVSALIRPERNAPMRRILSMVRTRFVKMAR